MLGTSTLGEYALGESPRAAPPTGTTTRTVVIELGDGAGVAANLSGITLLIYDEATLAAVTTTKYRTSTGATDASGKITATYASTLGAGSAYAVMEKASDGRHWCGQVTATAA